MNKNILEKIKSFPPPSLKHLIYLTDDTGIIQHAKYGIPDKASGYCLDDNSRALIAILRYLELTGTDPSIDFKKLINIYLSYILLSQREDGQFHNFMSYDRNFLDEAGSEDSFGRTIWALGDLFSSNSNSNYSKLAQFIWERANPWVEKIHSLRAVSYCLLGLCLKPENLEQIKLLSSHLEEAYQKNSSPGWQWYEPYLTYANARIPEALLNIYQVTGNKKILKTAAESLDFLESAIFENGILRLIGNKGWYMKEGKKAFFDEQPIDASSAVEVFALAYSITGREDYLEKAITAMEWFYGKNILGVNLVENETGACCDGFSSDGANDNQGAESTIKYLLARLTIERLAKEEQG